MIERYNIKFGPAVSQKELEKALNEGGEMPLTNLPDLKTVKARMRQFIDLVERTALSRTSPASDEQKRIVQDRRSWSSWLS